MQKQRIESLIGELVRLYREHNRQTIREVAIKAGCSSGTITQIERGYINPSEDLTARLGDALNLTEQEASSLLFARNRRAAQYLRPA
jgi:transcriptional regulator with XRE-family HTH domain